MTVIAEIPDAFTPPASAFHATAPEGELFLWEAGPNVVAEKGSGIISLALAQGVVEFWRRVPPSGRRFQIFIDLERVTHYTREARDTLTSSSMARLPALEGLHILLSSKNLALGISAFKHEIGDRLVHTYADRASFLESYGQAARRRP
jgi:hypothetical protein